MTRAVGQPRQSVPTAYEEVVPSNISWTNLRRLQPSRFSMLLKSVYDLATPVNLLKWKGVRFSTVQPVQKTLCTGAHPIKLCCFTDEVYMVTQRNPKDDCWCSADAMVPWECQWADDGQVLRPTAGVWGWRMGVHIFTVGVECRWSTGQSLLWFLRRTQEAAESASLWMWNTR